MCHFFWQQRCMLGLLYYSVVVWMKGTLFITFYSSMQSIVCAEKQNWNSVTCIAGLYWGHACRHICTYNSPFLSHHPLFSLPMCSTISVYLSVCLHGDTCIWKHFFGMCDWPFPPENYYCIWPCYMICHVLLHIYNMPEGNTLHSQATLA
jgi:hypothetical protein